MPFSYQKPEGIVRVHCLDHVRDLDDRGHAGERQDGEPDDHERTEGPGDPLGTLLLDREEQDGDRAGDHDKGRLVHSLKPPDQEHTFHGAQDTDGRRDDSVADDERDADEGEHGDDRGLSARFEERDQEFAEHDGAAFAAFAEAHGQPGVLHGNEDDERPDDEREHADDVVTLSAWSAGR